MEDGMRDTPHHQSDLNVFSLIYSFVEERASCRCYTFSLFVGNWIALNWFCIEGIFLCWIILSNVMLHCYEPGHCWRGWVMKRNVSKLTYSHHSLLTPAALPILK